MEPNHSEVPPISTETPPVPPIETPPVPIAPSTPVEPSLPAPLLNAYNALVADARADAQRARDELARVTAERNAPPALSDAEASEQFFKNPLKMIQDQIDRSIKPINDGLQQFQRVSQYDTLKAQMRADPRFSELDKIATHFDQLMQNQPLEPNVMIGVYYTALGIASSRGELNSTAAIPNNTPAAPMPTPPAPITPPHLRPTAPAVPALPAQSLRPLTENEEIVRRANRQTHKEYLDGMSEGALKL